MVTTIVSQRAVRAGLRNVRGRGHANAYRSRKIDTESACERTPLPYPTRRWNLGVGAGECPEGSDDHAQEEHDRKAARRPVLGLRQHDTKHAHTKTDGADDQADGQKLVRGANRRHERHDQCRHRKEERDAHGRARVRLLSDCVMMICVVCHAGILRESTSGIVAQKVPECYWSERTAATTASAVRPSSFATVAPGAEAP